MVKGYSVTDIGQRRELNEDFSYLSNTAVGTLPNLYIVADGMGGHQAGDYASRYAVTRVKELSEAATPRPLKEILDRALHVVNQELRTIASSDVHYAGMGTTMVAAVVKDDRLLVGNVGDSRLYLFHENHLHQITVDHSLVEEMVLAGGIDEARARTHPDKNIITRAIGAEDVLQIDFFSVALTEGDTILMCTDGLTNMLEDEEIAGILKTADRSLAQKAEALVNAANQNGGRDNITVLLIDPFDGGLHD